ncbi:MAG: hypothetical protein ACKV2T_01530 [Kofleriaceae bacterium]
MVAARRDVLIVRALLLVALAACDQVFGLDDRAKLDAGTGDGSAPPSDGLTSSCFFAEPSQSGVAADAWFPDAALQRAVRLSNSGFVEIGEDSGKTVDMFGADDYSAAFVSLPAGYSAMFHPSLSADGALLMGLLLHEDGFTHRLAIAPRTLQIFATPAPADLRTANDVEWMLFASHTPSGPTSTTPRRMIITSTVGVTEVVEQTATWRAAETFFAPSFGLGVVTYATLTSNGLGLVLVGTTTANPNAQKVMLATRDSLDGPFGAASEIFRPAGGVGTRSAYLTADCSRLFFLQQGEVRSVVR